MSLIYDYSFLYLATLVLFLWIGQSFRFACAVPLQWNKFGYFWRLWEWLCMNNAWKIIKTIQSFVHFELLELLELEGFFRSILEEFLSGSEKQTSGEQEDCANLLKFIHSDSHHIFTVDVTVVYILICTCLVSGLTSSLKRDECVRVYLEMMWDGCRFGYVICGYRYGFVDIDAHIAM